MRPTKLSESVPPKGSFRGGGTLPPSPRYAPPRWSPAQSPRAGDQQLPSPLPSVQLPPPGEEPTPTPAETASTVRPKHPQHPRRKATSRVDTAAGPAPNTVEYRYVLHEAGGQHPSLESLAPAYRAFWVSLGS